MAVVPWMVTVPVCQEKLERNEPHPRVNHPLCLITMVRKLFEILDLKLMMDNYSLCLCMSGNID